MELESRVVWAEGMQLAQHHFQQQTRYYEDLTGFALAQLFYAPYGVAACELDHEALRNGTAAVTHARGIMPDGLPFHFSDDPLPEPLDIREIFSPTQDSHLLLLAIPGYRPQKANCALPGEGDGTTMRYRSAVRAVPDDTTGMDEKPIAFAQKNFRLMLDGGSTEGLITLPLARVRRDGSGHYVYDEEYIPPCLRIRASERLSGLLARLVEMMDAKAESLSVERGSDPDGAAEFAPREIAGHWLAHAVHSALAPLRHHLRTGTAHPEALYLELSRLAGALCTFSLHAHPRDLPAYDHDHLDACFGALERAIREHLDVVLPTGGVGIPLEKTDEYLWRGTVADPRCLGRAEWFLGVRSRSGADVVSRVPKLAKVCSEKHILRLVKEAFPGLTLTHDASPPAAIAPRRGTQYFRIETAGPCWKSIVDTKSVGVYAPAALDDAELSLVVLPEAG